MTVLALALLPALLLLSAFFSSSETVLFSLTGDQRSRIAAKSPRVAEIIQRSMDDRAVLFSTILVGNTFVNFAISALGYAIFRDWLPGKGWLAVPVMTLLLLVFGEITPKRLALEHAERLAPMCARMLVFWRWVLTPCNLVLRHSSRAFEPMLTAERRALSDDELVAVMDSAAEQGVITEADADMLEGVLRLSELHASDEMTPRVDIEGYDMDLDEEARRRTLTATRHRFLPVIRRTADMVEGVIDVASGKVSDALFVPESVGLDDLLLTFAHSRKPLAIVLDEYGGTAGLITPNDILELIVGPAVFGSANEEPQIRQVGPETWEIDARASLEEINRELDVNLFADDADRLSGWVQYHAERIPHVGQVIEADNCVATVLKRYRRRVTLVLLEVKAHPEVMSDEAIIAETDQAVEKTKEDDQK